MKTGTLAALATLLAATQVSAHMRMSSPPPLRSKDNPNSGSDINYSETSPLSSDGSNYPCQGSLSVLGTDEAKSVEQYVAGQSYSITIDGGAFHGGGSCQISLSYDQGKTFKVIKSFIGSCPVSNGPSQLSFTMPADAPDGEPLLAWSWFNQIGNREMYMQCASVTASGGSGDAASFASSYPDIFLANIGNGCSTTEGTDVVFPDPGKDVDEKPGKTGPPTGSCGSAAPASPASPPAGDSGKGSGSGSPPPDGGAGNAGGSGGGAGATTSDAPAAPKEPVPSPPAAEQPDKGGNTLPGAVFVTVPDASGSGPQPTTLVTATKSSSPDAQPTDPAAEPEAPAADSSGSEPSAPVASTAPAAPVAPQPTSGSGSGSGSGSVTGAQSGACSDEGAWNCIGGTQFQRCASGQWSIMMPMAAGTSCKPGISNDLFAKKKFRFMRY